MEARFPTANLFTANFPKTDIFNCFTLPNHLLCFKHNIEHQSNYECDLDVNLNPTSSVFYYVDSCMI